MFPAETRVLIVDDLKTIRHILHDILSRNGLTRIKEFSDGEEAYNALEKGLEEGDPYGLVISDWNMPKISGFDLLIKKNQHPKLKKTPFLLVTIESEREYVLKAIAMGVDDFIVKPFSERIVLKKLENVWKKVNYNKNSNKR